MQSALYGPADRAPDQCADETEDERQWEIGAPFCGFSPDERGITQPADRESDPGPAHQADQERGIHPSNHRPRRPSFIGAMQECAARLTICGAEKRTRRRDEGGEVGPCGAGRRIERVRGMATASVVTRGPGRRNAYSAITITARPAHP